MINITFKLLPKKKKTRKNIYMTNRSIIWHLGRRLTFFYRLKNVLKSHQFFPKLPTEIGGGGATLLTSQYRDRQISGALGHMSPFSSPLARSYLLLFRSCKSRCPVVKVHNFILFIFKLNTEYY